MNGQLAGVVALLLLFKLPVRLVGLGSSYCQIGQGAKMAVGIVAI